MQANKKNNADSHFAGNRLYCYHTSNPLCFFRAIYMCKLYVAFQFTLFQIRRIPSGQTYVTNGLLGLVILNNCPNDINLFTESVTNMYASDLKVVLFSFSNIWFI